MHSLRIAIVGAGLSGLYAAYRLEQMGISDYVLIEARDVVGGRIASGNHGQDRFDLGPTWFWPDIQPQLDALIHELALERFAQFEDGDTLIERTPGVPPTRIQGYVNVPASMRLSGGMGQLIEALHQRIDPARVVTGQAVRQLKATDQSVELLCENSSGSSTRWQAGQVLMAVPPRLTMEHIAFSPALPQAQAEQWRATATWMAPHAKYIATYTTPFWREHGLSGEARSAIGPLSEIHDASTPGDSAALFGFFGIPAEVRKSVPPAVLRSHCRAQLTRLFGPQAATPSAEFIKDWAWDIYTASSADRNEAGQHSQPPVPTIPSGPWCNKIVGIGSEWSPQFPGYVAGAIDAVNRAMQGLSNTSGNELK
ncbi:flavin monoamine oxidase family protein [Microbulbifer hydrolyticus]|nr:FAD-dependent oxidoreductase [Microbulbifer hydrolyticus]MBB5212419.1 monoamine oxidase [Microbulbifer hydrolyticus]